MNPFISFASPYYNSSVVKNASGLTSFMNGNTIFIIISDIITLEEVKWKC